MSGILQVFKALCLFYLGIVAKDVLVDEANQTFIKCTIYYMFLTTICYNYAMNFKHAKLPGNNLNVTIIGAGFSGIGMAVKLKQLGVKFRIIDKEKRLGGTWNVNQYPGCACDVPSHLYSYSFFLNPKWSYAYSYQPEILNYLEEAADKFNISRHIELGKKVLRTAWDEDAKKWTVELDNGETFTTDVIVNGIGLLHQPATPDFLGDDVFKGDKFHSAEWPVGYDVKGKRVAVIGTGASAVQIVPTIAEQVPNVTVFQRTPCWVPPKRDFKHPEWMKFLWKVFPPLMYLFRTFYFWRQELGFWTLFRMEGMNREKVKDLITKHYERVIKDPETRKKLLPTYDIGCKRITPSNFYLQSYNRENVSLITDKIKCFVENGIQTDDGKVHEFDTIIYATGFDLIKSFNAFDVLGRKDPTTGVEQRCMKDQFSDEPQAYKGITCPGFPNFYFLLGPGTGLGHNSVVFMIECQISYVVDALVNMVNLSMNSLDVKKEANSTYQAWVQDDMKNKVFAGSSCFSWYKNAAGVNWTLWPSHLLKYWWITRTFDIDAYNG